MTFKLPFKLALMKFQPKPFTKVKFIPRSIQHPLLLTGHMIAIWPHSLLVPVFDVDPEEGEAEDDAHGGSHAEGRVHGGVDPGLLDPGVCPVLRRLGLILRPDHRVTPLHVECSENRN